MSFTTPKACATPPSRSSPGCGSTRPTPTRAARNNHLHFGKGANGVTLYLGSGEKFAFRGRQGPDRYDRVEVLDAPRNGWVLATLDGPEDSEQFFDLLTRALAPDRATVA